MKLPAQPLIWTHRAWAKTNVLVDGRCEPGQDALAVEVECETTMVRRQPASGSLSVPLRIVGILAFCQMLVFLALFLFICARAGAATKGNPTSGLELSPSAYTPQSARDPFGSEVPKPTGPTQLVGTDALKLQGILYSTTNPSALVNDQLVELNKTAKVHTDQGDVEVKALKITRELVLLDVGGRNIELRLGGGEHNPATK